MRKFTLPLSLLVLFWLFVSLRVEGDADVAQLVAASPGDVVEPPLSSSSVMALTGEQLEFAGLMNDYLAVFGILVAAVILAMRRRAHLVFGRRHGRR